MTQFFSPHLPHLGRTYYRRGKKIPKGFYRITTKAVAMNEIGQILLLKEERYGDKKSEFYREGGGMYDLPGGGLDWGEDFREGLQREICEEMGIDEAGCKIAENPLYIQIAELDDRYHEDPERDDFYPTCMMYFPVRFLKFDFLGSRECASYIWLSIEKFSDKQIWTHSASLARIFQKESFPKELISTAI